MKKPLIVVALLSLALPYATAQEWAKQNLEKSPRHQEWVKIKHDNREVNAFVVYPEARGKTPVVIVIHEIFGLTDWARSAADEVAAKGYIAVAPDLLSGFGPKGGGSTDFTSTQDATKAVSGLDADTITADLNAVADYAKKLPASNGKLAVAGFCWGGSQSFRFATNRKDLSAAFVFYGGPPKDVSSITAPVYGFYASEDARIGATIPDTVKAMQDAGKAYNVEMYKGAGHGFMRAGEDPGNTNPDNKEAHDRAWASWAQFLKAM